MADGKTGRNADREQEGVFRRLLGGISRFVLFLNWFLLLAVLGFILYLIGFVRPG